jgi:hypothetical protein
MRAISVLIGVALCGAPLFAQDVVTHQLLPKDQVSAQPLHTGRAVGTLDQASPFASATPPGMGSASFNGDANFLVWQTDVRCGIAGQLEGFEIECAGQVGATIDLRIRMGGGWSTNPVVWSGSYTNSTGSTEIGWLDTSAANIQLNAGDLFLIEWQGTGTGLWMTGTYAAPPATPAYPELIYLNAPGCFADCGWRIGFNTYMTQGGGGPQLSTSPIVGGQQATLSVTGATPANAVGFAASVVGQGPSTVPAGPCGSVTLDLSQPIVRLAILPADALGNASFTGNVPAALSGRTIWLQAFDVGSCTATNMVSAVVG